MEKNVSSPSVSPTNVVSIGSLPTAALPDLSSQIGATASDQVSSLDKDLSGRLDDYALETIVELKISRFLDRLGSYEPEELHNLIIGKVEKPLLAQVLRRTGGNQVHAARILGINRNTLRKKMKIYGLAT